MMGVLFLPVFNMFPWKEFHLLWTSGHGTMILPSKMTSLLYILTWNTNSKSKQYKNLNWPEFKSDRDNVNELMPGIRRAFRFPELSKIYAGPKLHGRQDFIIPYWNEIKIKTWRNYQRDPFSSFLLGIDKDCFKIGDVPCKMGTILTRNFKNGKQLLWFGAG